MSPFGLSYFKVILQHLSSNLLTSSVIEVCRSFTHTLEDIFEGGMLTVRIAKLKPFSIPFGVSF